MMNLSGKTPVDIQEYLGLSCVQTVYRWLEGINIPSVDNLYALSQMFNIPMDAMIGGNRKNLEFYPVKFMVFDWGEGFMDVRIRTFSRRNGHILSYFQYFIKESKAISRTKR